MSGTIFLSVPYLLIRALCPPVALCGGGNKQVVRLASGTVFFPSLLSNRENMEYHTPSSLGRNESTLSSRTLASRRKRIVGLEAGVGHEVAVVLHMVQ